MELAWVVGGEEVIGVDWSEALFAHASRSFLAAEDHKGLEAVSDEVCLFLWVGGGGAN